MKHLAKIIPASLLLIGLQFASSGCVADGYVGTDVYYGPHYSDPWFRNDRWMDRRRGGYRDSTHTDIYISPPRPPRPPRIRLP